MKLLSKDLLREYGFIDGLHKSNGMLEVMTRDQFDVVIKENNSFYYSNLGIDYPLKDIAGLKKLCKAVKGIDLRPLKIDSL